MPHGHAELKCKANNAALALRPERKRREDFFKNKTESFRVHFVHVNRLSSSERVMYEEEVDVFDTKEEDSPCINPGSFRMEEIAF